MEHIHCCASNLVSFRRWYDAGLFSTATSSRIGRGVYPVFSGDFLLNPNMGPEGEAAWRRPLRAAGSFASASSTTTWDSTAAMLHERAFRSVTRLAAVRGAQARIQRVVRRARRIC